MPKVSIITPTYKGAAYIAETIQSVQDQDFSDYEHIIINDNSPDNTEDIIQSIMKRDSKILYIKNNQNLGIAGSRNKGIQQSQGEYLCFLDHDDVFLDNSKLSKQVKFLDDHSDYGIVASLIITIDSKGNEIKKNTGRETDQDIRSHFLQSNQFLPCSMMIRKEAIVEGGGFDSNYDKSDDYDLRMKVGRNWKMYCFQEYMTGYRVHGNNTSSSWKALYHMRRLAWKIYRKNIGFYPNAGKAFIMRCIELLLPPPIVDFILTHLKPSGNMT